MDFDWHGGPISRDTIVDASYKTTQNVRRFLVGACGPDFKFDRDFKAWDVADEWQRRRRPT